MRAYLVKTKYYPHKLDETEKFINKEGNLYLYYGEAFNRLKDDISFKNKLVNYIFDYYGEPFDRQKIIGQFSKQSYEEYRDKINWFCNQLLSIPLTNHNFRIAGNAFEKSNPNVIPFEISEFENRERALGHKINKIAKILVSIKYNIVHTFLVRSNQLSTHTDDIFHTGEYDIETFGSAFNTRLPRYGHLYTGQTKFERELEKPFGGIGSYDEILEGVISGNIKTKGILVGPPSSKNLHVRAIGYVRKISEMKLGINVCLVISLTKLSLMGGLEKLAVDKKIIKEAFLFLANGKVKTVKLGYDWCNFYFKF